MLKGVCLFSKTLLQGLKLQSSGTADCFLFSFSMSSLAAHFIEVVVHFKKGVILVIEEFAHLPKCLSNRSEEPHRSGRSLRVLGPLGRSVLGKRSAPRRY